MENSALTEADWPDIQGLVLSGYGNLTCSRFVFLQIQDAARTRTWLKQLLPSIMTAAFRPPGSPKPTTSINIALTFEGLQLLGLPQDASQAFPREFQEGMAGGERPRVLGDTEDSDPGKWDVGGPGHDMHVLLLFYATDDTVLQPLVQAQKTLWETGGLVEIYSQDTGRISDYEPFGFRDGISQPFITGSFSKPSPGETPVKAGEFLLGYINEYDNLTPSPTVAASADGNNVLPTVNGETRKDFGRNGSYLIFRKLAQNVEGFWQFLREKAGEGGQQATEEHVKWLAAKLVGRWPDGAPLVLSPDHEDTTLGQDDSRNNDFLFMTLDPHGYRCPLGAHIRRSNPRDALLPNPAASQVIAKRHRLVRRGRHYEEKRPDALASDGTEHGLCFIALNADIQRQFEFIQQTWINSPKFSGLYDNKDPLVGDNDGNGHMTIQGQPLRKHLCGLPRFVQTRGGGYFFLPGMRALRFLSELSG